MVGVESKFANDGELLPHALAPRRDRVVPSIEKLESAVDKLELRIDAHDRIPSSDRRSG